MSKAKIEWYGEFIDESYKPSDSDLVVMYYFEPNNMKTADIVGRLASESSVGTWTTLETLDKRVYDMRARTFWYNDNYAKIAYPLELWETDNIPQLLSGIAGNIFGMKAIKSLRLIDATIPLKFVETNKGPVYGTTAIQEILKKKEGPITATVPKPKIGLMTEQHLKIAKDAWSGGIDCIKDDENLTNQKFNPYKNRVEGMAKVREQVENDTGDIKEAWINVTAETHEMERRVKVLHDNGFRYFMMDVVTCGYSAMHTMSNLAHDLGMAIHGHRAMHAIFTKHYTHGMSMYFLAKLTRLMGIDNIHIGTVVGKLDSPKEDVLNMIDLLLNTKIEERPNLNLAQDWGSLKSGVPVASGGLHAGTIPQVMEIYNTLDMGIQVGGGVHGHPDGTHGGAKATIQAIEAFKDGLTLEEKAKTHPALAKSLEKFGYVQPI